MCFFLPPLKERYICGKKPALKKFVLCLITAVLKGDGCLEFWECFYCFLLLKVLEDIRCSVQDG
jgi:hypothetical protein